MVSSGPLPRAACRAYTLDRIRAVLGPRECARRARVFRDAFCRLWESRHRDAHNETWEKLFHAMATFSDGQYPIGGWPAGTSLNASYTDFLRFEEAFPECFRGVYDPETSDLVSFQEVTEELKWRAHNVMDRVDGRWETFEPAPGHPMVTAHP